MDDLVALAYVSSAAHLLSERELELLLLDARAENTKMQLSGTLLYNDGSFFQYLEGPPSGVAKIYERIKRSTLHHGLIEFFYHKVDRRHFDDWKMGFSHAPQSLILNLSQASWLEEVNRTEGEPDPSAGLALLLQFWKTATRGR